MGNHGGGGMGDVGWKFIPEELAALERWMAWKQVKRGEKLAKVPIGRDGKAIDATDPNNWLSIDEARSVAEKHGTGIGIALGGLEDGLRLGGVDLDACIDPDHEDPQIADWAAGIIDLFSSYTELSPSRTGFKILAYNAPETLPRKQLPMPGPEIRGKRPQIEAYVDKRWFAITGEHLAKTPKQVERSIGWNALPRLDGQEVSPDGPSTPAGGKFPETDLVEALEHIDPDERENYVTVIRAVKLSAEDAEFDSERAKGICRDWAMKSDKYDPKDFDKRWDKDFKRKGGRVQRLGTIFKMAADNGWQRLNALDVDDFYCHMPSHSFIYIPSREFWPSTSVNERVPLSRTNGMPPSKVIAQRRHVDQVTWWPGQGELITDKLISEGGTVPHQGARVFNRYLPPTIVPGKAGHAARWIDLLESLYPDDHEHIAQWLAHRRRHPGVKINHSLVLGGRPGVGKDSLLVPVRHAVGDWNMREVSPVNLVESFNDWVEAVILRVSEARDLGGNDLSAANRYSLYEHLKVLTAAPPETLRVNLKHVRQFYAPNVVGLIVTTNHPDGLYLPPDDRRFFVAWSEADAAHFGERYWNDLHGWYCDGGIAHVVAYLDELDLDDFDPKATPPMTDGKRQMIDAGRDDHLGPIGDALEKLEEKGISTDAIVLEDLKRLGGEELEQLLSASPRKVPHLLAHWGYVKVVNCDAPSDGKWRVDGKRQAVYAKRDLTMQDRLDAARRLEARVKKSTGSASTSAKIKKPDPKGH